MKSIKSILLIAILFIFNSICLANQTCDSDYIAMSIEARHGYIISFIFNKNGKVITGLGEPKDLLMVEKLKEEESLSSLEKKAEKALENKNEKEYMDLMGKRGMLDMVKSITIDSEKITPMLLAAQKVADIEQPGEYFGESENIDNRKTKYIINICDKTYLYTMANKSQKLKYSKPIVEMEKALEDPIKFALETMRK